MKKFNFQDRLIAFAGEVILFVYELELKNKNFYLHNQLLRSSGSAALNFAESQGTFTVKDYISKASIALKELKECEVNLRILDYIKRGGEKRIYLLNENVELIKILRTIIKNKSSH